MASLHQKSLPPMLDWQLLHQASYQFKQEFCLTLKDNQLLIAHEIVRLVPKKRMVIFGKWKGRNVVAKLFFNERKRKHAAIEQWGNKLLQQYRIPTAQLLDHTKSNDGSTEILIFERIMDADNLYDLWQAKTNIAQILPVLKFVAIELATQHVFGVIQNDLHFKNFLVNEKSVFTLDGAQISCFGDRLPKQESMQNLALLLAQMGVNTEAYQEQLFKFYAKARGWRLKEKDTEQLFKYIDWHQKKRWQNYVKKIYRNCTDFSRAAHKNLIMYQNECAGPELLTFLKNPEEVFSSESSELIKSGRSATIIKVNFDEKQYVIKRYNMKNFFHWMRRAFRRSRAAKVWQFGLKLNLFGIATPKPIAFIEERKFGIRYRSYFVSQYVTGTSINHLFATLPTHSQELTKLVARFKDLISGMAKLNVTHGDLKLTNFYVNANNEPMVLDLDGAKEHSNKFKLKKALKKDTHRLLKNFAKDSFLYELFKRAFSLE